MLGNAGKGIVPDSLCSAFGDYVGLHAEFNV